MPLFSAIYDLVQNFLVPGFDIALESLSFRHEFFSKFVHLRRRLTEMTDRTKYPFWAVLLIGLLMTTLSAAQEPDEPMPQVGARSKSAYMGYRVEKGDTVYYDSINPIWIFPRGRQGKSDLKKYYRLVYNFNKVYPYAMLAKDLTLQVDDHIAGNALRRRQKEKSDLLSNGMRRGSPHTTTSTSRRASKRNLPTSLSDFLTVTSSASLET